MLFNQSRDGPFIHINLIFVDWVYIVVLTTASHFHEPDGLEVIGFIL